MADTSTGTGVSAPTGSDPDTAEGAIVHASTIAWRGRALLIQGASGSGKSALALACIGQGAELVADDRTVLTRHGGGLRAAPPPPIAGLIEVRGLGLLSLPWVADVPLAGVVDLDTPEDDRLPPYRTITLLGTPLSLFRKVEGPHFAVALLHCLAGARREPEPMDDASR